MAKTAVEGPGETPVRRPRRQFRRLSPIILAALITLGATFASSGSSFQTRAEAAPSNVSMAGVHWYSGDSSMLDTSLPLGQRGWNVEVIFDVGWCDGDDKDPGGVRSVAQRAKDHGLVNIFRVDYRDRIAVPQNSADFASWSSSFIKCTQDLSDLASLYIVGNEPNIEGHIGATQYADAFNYLWSRRGEMPASTELLSTFISPFSPETLTWLKDVASRLNGVKGFALHTGGIRSHCQDPRQACQGGRGSGTARSDSIGMSSTRLTRVGGADPSTSLSSIRTRATRGPNPKTTTSAIG